MLSINGTNSTNAKSIQDQDLSYFNQQFCFGESDPSFVQLSLLPCESEEKAMMNEEDIDISNHYIEQPHFH